MNEVLAKLYQMFLGVLTSILSTLLISVGLFCISWYLATDEFPPKMQHVKERYSQYKEMIKLSQVAMEKLQQPSATVTTASVPQEEWNQLNLRVQKLELELQALKNKTP